MAMARLPPPETVIAEIGLRAKIELEVQVAPESVEDHVACAPKPPDSSAINLLPSADDATAYQYSYGALEAVQVAPEFVERYIEALFVPYES
jgi:hypothetical protein